MASLKNLYLKRKSDFKLSNFMLNKITFSSYVSVLVCAQPPTQGLYSALASWRVPIKDPGCDRAKLVCAFLIVFFINYFRV